MSNLPLLKLDNAPYSCQLYENLIIHIKKQKQKQSPPEIIIVGHSTIFPLHR